MDRPRGSAKGHEGANEMQLSPEERRFVVVGTSSSGKTTCARRLADAIEVPCIQLDELYWGPGWREAAPDLFRARVDEATSGDAWVVDGNYSTVRDLTWSRATSLIWLHYPFAVVFSRALRRTIHRAATRQELFSGNRESFRQSFLSRESILWWIIRTHGKYSHQYRELLDGDACRHLVVREFRRPAETERFLVRLERRPAPPAGPAGADPGPFS